MGRGGEIGGDGERKGDIGLRINTWRYWSIRSFGAEQRDQSSKKQYLSWS